MEGGLLAVDIMALTTKQKIINFLYYFPKSTITEISENTSLNGHACYKHVSSLIKAGDVTLTKEGRKYFYQLAPGCGPVHAGAMRFPAATSRKKIAECEENIQRLLDRGLRRRALTEMRRLSAMQITTRGVEKVAHGIKSLTTVR
ncbi:winged helix-turn-helix transcriptional regulator [Cronobacter sp. EKM101R]|nr:MULTISPECIES: winged helix-turn-helix domain-containing protein [Cronobacter]KAF6592933.1 winged helix-turn-helix transcriptional regulator [Cronobacter sp. EKM101R]KAF6600324.1 winged helix-turn-helix transcriptional regulator [Cronobacter sp. EKM102R]MDK1182949.1 winged helix-turn-helix domain-containing protein [Cronobacter turicensis]MDK1207954.1 winged helix-turn-helix domain-containing protein [Cronobacter turicensis]MDK1236511.1 winged helix-turn-helix domain-containing protein [Cron